MSFIVTLNDPFAQRKQSDHPEFLPSLCRKSALRTYSKNQIGAFFIQWTLAKQEITR